MATVIDKTEHFRAMKVRNLMKAMTIRQLIDVRVRLVHDKILRDQPFKPGDVAILDEIVESKIERE